MTNIKSFNILELYSGIGGFHYAIKKLFEEYDGMKERVNIIAVDINTTANNIYRHNFDKQCSDYRFKLLERNIQSFTVKEIDSMQLDLLTMSPPCQPFSRLGLKRDLQDKRCDSFHYLMKILPELQHMPKFIMLENVKGFETSEAHELLLEILSRCRYQFKEFLLTPLQFGIPNARLRYYLVAKYIPNMAIPLKSAQTNRIYDGIPSTDCDLFEQEGLFSELMHTTLSQKTIESYLDSNPNDLQETFLPDKTLLRYHMLYDIVEPNSTTSNCFTKGYTRRIEGTGSILKTASNVTVDEVYLQLEQIKSQIKQDGGDVVGNDKELMITKLLSTLRLRFFSPREIANLMCFPSYFEFPLNVNMKQQYRVLGNSVNVYVCYYLLKVLLGPMKF